MRIVAWWIALGVLLSCSTPTWAGPYEEGRQLYKVGRYREAAEKFERAVQQDPSNAKAWWQLNFAYNKLRRYADALAAAERAGSLDPAYRFASSPAKYRETVDRLRRKAGVRAAPSSGGLPSQELGPLSGPDGTMSQQLQKRGVFVQQGASVDVGRLISVIRELEPVPVRFLVFGSPAGSAALSREADRVRRYLGLRDGYVIACSRAGVAASSETLSRERLRELTRQAAVRMEAGDYTGALADLARGLVSERARQTRTRQVVGFSVLGGAAGLILVWVLVRRMARARSMRARRAVLEQRKAEVIAEMNYLEDASGAAPAAVAAQVQQARLEAGNKLDEAARIMVRSRDEYELSRALDLLDEAQATVSDARGMLDAALTGKPLPTRRGRGAVPPVYAETARTGAETKWDDVPEHERGVCFFCSRPALLSELVPVTVELEGQKQKVLACRQDYESIRQGQPPRIRAFERDGRYVPWYADPDYDPYRDYYRRGYDASDMMRDLIMLNLIDRMFWDWQRPSWGWGGGHGYGWDGYTFWPGHHHYQDYYSERAAGSDFSDDYGRHAAGTDFLDTGADFADSSAGAGTDFLGGDES